MVTDNDDKYTPEEESFDPEGIAALRQKEEEERLNRRIRREIIKIESGESDEAIEEERQRMEEEEAERKAEEERQHRRKRSLLHNLFTSGFLTSDGASRYFWMPIVIAAMCFFCIFLTFLALNADREYRQMEKRVLVLRERAIIFEDRRYSISTREEVNKLLEKHNIELEDLDNDSRVIRE